MKSCATILALNSRCAHAQYFRHRIFVEKMSRVLALLSLVYLASAASDVRLVNLDGSYDTQVGRVEVYLHNKWGQVCGDGFSSVDAGVVCTSLGYSGYGGLETSNQGIGNLSIVIGYVDCSGQETSILQCSYRYVC